MSARVVVFFVLVSHMLVSECVIMKINMADNSIKELSPLLIQAGLDDIIIISVPAVDRHTLYYINKPNGEELHLNMCSVIPDYKSTRQIVNNDIEVKYFNEESKTISLVKKYTIINLNYIHRFNNKDIEMDLMSNDFMIGPLEESEHGNWILSAYYKGNGGEWSEMFQVITVEIKETIPTSPDRPMLYPGEDLYLRFPYPLQHLESCEIIAPRSTFDRFYDRDNIYLDSCGFQVPNVTTADEGLWKIIGVGKIVYEANIFLQIKSNVT